MAAKVSLESWVNVFCFLLPKDFISLRKTQKRFRTLSKCSTNNRINKYWQGCSYQFCDQIASSYSTHDWETFFKELKLIAVQISREYDEYIAKNDDSENKSNNDHKDCTNVSAITLRYRDTDICDGEKSINNDNEIIIDTNDTDDNNPTNPKDINSMIKMHIQMYLCYSEPDTIQRYNNSQIELNRFKKYDSRYLHPLLIQCIKYDCVNIFEMLLHHENYHINMMIDATNIYNFIYCQKLAAKAFAEGRRISRNFAMDEEFKYVTPSILACEYGSIKIVKLLLNKDDIDLTIVRGLQARSMSYYKLSPVINDHDSPRMQHALLSAILCGEEEIAAILIEHKNMTNEMLFDSRVFYFACAKCLLKTVKILLSKGADPNVVTVLGRIHSINEGSHDIKKLAISCVISQLSVTKYDAFDTDDGIDSKYLRDRHGCDDAKELFDFLVSYKNIDLNCDNGRETPLITAIRNLEPNEDNIEIIQSLINNGADVNKSIGNTCNCMVWSFFFSFCFVFLGLM